MVAKPPKAPHPSPENKVFLTYCEKTNEELKLFQQDPISARRIIACPSRSRSCAAPTHADVQDCKEPLMMWKRGNKSMVGVDIGSSSVKAVELQGKNGDFQLVSLGYEALAADSVAVDSAQG